MRFVASLILPLMLACEGCVSFAYSRFRPEAPGANAKAECVDAPPLADLLIGLGLAGAGFAANYLRKPVDGCSFNPQDPSCRSQVGFYIPAMVAGASMTYGVAAYVVCENRLWKISSPGWQPQSSPLSPPRIGVPLSAPPPTSAPPMHLVDPPRARGRSCPDAEEASRPGLPGADPSRPQGR